MKRIVPVLLSLFLLAGCLLAAVPASALVLAEDPSPAPASGSDGETVTGPKAEAPFRYFRFYDQPDWENLDSGVMFSADLDQDGTEEPVSFTLDPEEDTTTITWGESSVLLEESSMFVEAAVLDLDPASPHYNLLAVIDFGSDSYITFELHPENGQLVKGRVIDASWDWEENALWFYERTDFLGTSYGKRPYYGDGLTPGSEWLVMSYIPTEQELKDDWDSLVEGGAVLHAVMPVPCTIDGQPGVIPADSYVYRLRFRAGDELTEVSFLDGTVARIACSMGEHGWPFLIDGHDATDCFDNLFFAD